MALMRGVLCMETIPEILYILEKISQKSRPLPFNIVSSQSDKCI